MVGEDGTSRPPCVRTLQYGGTGSGQSLGTDRGCQVLRPGTPASLAGGRPLPRLLVRDGFDETQPKLTGSGIGARHARGASTTSPARYWPDITSRCGSGCCACTSWA